MRYDTIRFDIEQAKLHIGEKITFYENMTREDVLHQGLSFYDEEDMQTGWFNRGMQIFVAHRIRGFGLSFYHEQLKSLSFSLYEEGDVQYEYDPPFRRQNQFLREQLGEPDEFVDNFIAAYKYPWGGLSSMIDERGGAVRITMRWGPPLP